MAEEYRKINILEIHSSFGYAGGQRNMFSFAKYINKELFVPFAASYIEDGPYEQKYADIGIKTCSAKGDAQKILDFISQNKIDIIHIHRSGSSVEIETKILQGAKRINPDIVVIEKNVFGGFDVVNDGLIGCHFFQSMMHLNERYLPASGRKFDFSKMKVLYNIVDSESFKKYELNDRQIIAAKNEFGINQDEFVLGRIGRPDLAKWSDLVLEMIPHLELIHPKFKFILLGVPSSRKKMIERSALLKKHFVCLEPTGNDEKVNTFYQVIDVLAHSSKIGECNGNTINEAMFWKKPVITNSTPRKDNGQLEQINHLVDGIIANTPQTFARAVAYLAKNRDSYARMATSAHDRVVRLNDPKVIVSQLERVFVEKLAENSRFTSLKYLNNYDNIAYQPSESEIVSYRKDYKKRLKQDFGPLSFFERLTNYLSKPKRFYWKIKDFIEHRFFV